MGIPVAAGVWTGHPSAGLMATLGAFTALYGGGRPYASRAIALALVACAFAAAVMFGLWLEGRPWLVVPALAAVAMLATWLCNAVRLGPPGAYMFVLACAAGTALPVGDLSHAQAGLLVLAGGAVAWGLHTAGALVQLRGPERRAVAAAGRAVAACIQAGPGHPGARRAAAQALLDSWQMLVGFQPIPARSGGELQRLRAVNRDLHLVFASAIDPSATPADRDALLERARALTAEAGKPAIARPRGLAQDELPHGYPRAWALLREALAPGSNALRVVLRVGLATMLAGAILWWRPEGAWLVLVVMALQFVIEMIVVRHYALAVVFITGVALTIASGGHRVDDVAGLLLARGLDTLLGCACALAAFRLLPPRADDRTLGDGIAHALFAVRDTCGVLAAGNVSSPAARTVRRDLQRRVFELEQRLDDALAGSRAQRDAAERLWPAVAVCLRLAYRVLAACWEVERNGTATAPDATPLQPGDMPRVAATLEALARAWREFGPPPPPPPTPLPPLLREDVDDLRRILGGGLD